MTRGMSEVIALCMGFVGLIGTAATTGLPMWKVTAFIGENIIVMETRWEGLWMNCYRQASIRMQCKVYDSLLFLPPELQASRGLMCCALALSGVGLLLSLPGLRSISCIRDQPRIKSILLMVAGGMQILASLCVFIPVSWTGHVIIRDFYNPLLIDAQRRELGEALYIGWVTGAILFASGVMFLCRRFGSEAGSFDVYHPGITPKPMLTGFHPISSTLSSVGQQPLLQRSSFSSHHQAPSIGGAMVPIPHQAALYNAAVLPGGPVMYNGGTMMAHQQPFPHSSYTGSVYTLRNSSQFNKHSIPLTASQITQPYNVYSSGLSLQPAPPHPVYAGYNYSQSHSSSSSGMRI